MEKTASTKKKKKKKDSTANMRQLGGEFMRIMEAMREAREISLSVLLAASLSGQCLKPEQRISLRYWA